MKMEFRKKTAILLIAIFMISIFAVAIPIASAVTITVDDSGGADYTTITEALAVAVDSDVIEVYAGTYIEDLIIDVPNLELVAVEEATIQGILTGSFPEHPANILINADGVKIHGFTIESPDVPTGETSGGIILTGENIKIYDNVFVSRGVGVTDYPTCVAIQTLSSLIPATSYISGLDIYDNEFSGTPDNGYYGVYINPSSDATGLVTVRDNDFTGTIRQGIVTERSHTDITGNSLMTDELPADSIGYGIVVQEMQYLTSLSDILISGNIVSGSVPTNGFKRGICLGTTGQDLANILVTNNIVKGNKDGFRVRDADGVTINYNDISDSTNLGIDNQDLVNTLDATLNWWGTTVGTDILAMVSGPVDYTPWLSQDSVDLTGTVTGWLLTVSQAGEGGVTLNPNYMPSPGYSTGVDVILTATPAAGWEFSGWSGDASGTDPSVTITMDSDKTPIATFTLMPVVSISVDPLTVDLSGKLGSLNTVTVPVTVSNYGNVFVDVTATLTGPDADFFVRCLTIEGPTVLSWPYPVGTLQLVAPDDSITVDLGLDLTGESVTGTYSATLVFEATPPSP